MKLWGMAEAPGWIPPTEMLVVPWPESPQCRSSLLREGKAQFTPCCVPPPIQHKLGSPQGRDALCLEGAQGHPRTPVVGARGSRAGHKASPGTTGRNELHQSKTSC